ASIQPGMLWPRVHVGTGTTPPAPTDTGLVNYLGFIQSATNTAGNSGAPDYYSWTRLSWLSAIGAFGTTNLTEIGVGSTATDSLVSRELIRDGSGNPIAFPISVEEQLEVTYETSHEPPLTDGFATASIGSNRQDPITREL